MKICIMQPTYLPWLGWFDLADQSDTVIILDDVAFSKQSWQQRNRIRTINGLEKLSIPVKTSGRLGQIIAECEIVGPAFAIKTTKTINMNYSRAPFFMPNFDEFRTTLEAAVGTNRLVEINCALISWIAAKLEVRTPMIRASKLSVSGKRGEHVAAICESVGAEIYLSPAGGENYLIKEKEAFERRGITVQIQVYEHPEYPQQFSPFIPFASALDLIFNQGPKAGQVMRSGRRPSRKIGENPEYILGKSVCENSES